MTKFLPASMALAFLTGCQYHNTRAIKVELTPDIASHSFSVRCVHSSTGHCFVAFTGAHPSQIAFQTGHTVTIRDVDSGAGYCAEVRSDLLARCVPSLVPEHHVTMTRKMDHSFRQPE